ncbi:maleylpyruvate isomerase family mycothiol-dependent enzyme [Candidatus Poriferisocius sp.]|uniref:maleylpyruvate isomerase family mycothiol-dependent enzyme n=1 Tax=Candidatus Poriferisocius sp. TaxID=3101276 RepID=UPI003B5C2B6A
MSDPVVGLLEEVWASIGSLGADLSEEQWDTPTECPGWSVRDQVSHIIGIEQMLLGVDTEPPVAEGGLDGIAAFNEAQIAPRRGRPGAEVLAEMRDVCAQRLEMLRTLPAEKWDEVGFTPIGEAPYRTFMQIRVFDCWVHEQDMRRALGIPGHLGGPVAQHCLDWHARNMGYVVGKKAGAPDGTTVVFDVDGDADGPRAVAVTDGRAKLSAVPADPTVTVHADVDTYNAVCCGRTDPAGALADGRVTLSGDQDLGRRVVSALPYVT